MLEYATSLIDGHANEFKISDAIINLKRSINIRLKLLEEIYQLSNLDCFKKIGSIERLEAVGLAKPFIIKQLFYLRNEIEHNDASPPENVRAKELLDVTWYFLRSTDSAVTNHSKSLIFEDPDGDGDDTNMWLNIDDFSGISKEVKISGWLAPPILSYENGLEISVEKLSKPPVNASDRGLEYFKRHKNRDPNQRYFCGTIASKDDLLIVLWKKIFSMP